MATENGNEVDSDIDTGEEIQELNEKMDEMMKLIRDNQRMTRNLWHRARISAAISIVKWVIVIGAAIGAFYYIQPVIDAIMSMYESISGGGGSFMDFIKSW